MCSRGRIGISLGLDSDGAPVVAELKRGEAPDTVDLQALKYAAYCLQLTIEDVVDAYARHHNLDKENAAALARDENGEYVLGV